MQSLFSDFRPTWYHPGNEHEDTGYDRHKRYEYIPEYSVASIETSGAMDRLGHIIKPFNYGVGALHNLNFGVEGCLDSDEITKVADSLYDKHNCEENGRKHCVPPANFIDGLGISNSISIEKGIMNCCGRAKWCLHGGVDPRSLMARCERLGNQAQRDTGHKHELTLHNDGLYIKRGHSFRSLYVENHSNDHHYAHVKERPFAKILHHRNQSVNRTLKAF
mmetsp:Transcript_24018/g.44883  ORF Transcript_24018/g.44883 Transcript_24018/m.44883 type:complete len:220 (-) Transcript_24018:589-1248(-)